MSLNANAIKKIKNNMGRGEVNKHTHRMRVFGVSVTFFATPRVSRVYYFFFAVFLPFLAAARPFAWQYRRLRRALISSCVCVFCTLRLFSNHKCQLMLFERKTRIRRYVSAHVFPPIPGVSPSTSPSLFLFLIFPLNFRACVRVRAHVRRECLKRIFNGIESSQLQKARKQLVCIDRRAIPRKHVRRSRCMYLRLRKRGSSYVVSRG